MDRFRHALPELLDQLVAQGIWPAQGSRYLTTQELVPPVSPERVRLFADDETVVYFAPPPFKTVADEIRSGRSADFWQRFGAVHQIVPEEALIIGDFGPGSDSVIVLAFHDNAADPPVLRLRWGPRGTGNDWVQGAANFESFARLLGLVPDT